MCHERGLWLDLWGSSYRALAATPKQAQRAAQQFREAACWLETYGVTFLTHKKPKKAKKHESNAAT